MEKVSRPNSIVWRSYAKNKISKLIFKLILIKLISRRLSSVRSNDKSDRYEIWSPIIKHYYGSGKTSFVEIRDSVQSGYFYSSI